MSGPAIVRAVLTGNAGVTSLCPAAKIIADEVAPRGTALPFILVKHVSGVDYKPLLVTGSIHTRKRVQIEIHATTAPQRLAIKNAVRAATLSSPFPTVAGYNLITLHTEGEGPDFTAEEPFMRIGEQDVIVTYSEAV
jgi:Protein of unknown function (DUF3168)